MIADVEDVNAGQMEFEDLTMHMSDDHSRAFLKIQDGCNQFCSYCIIPYARGRVRCRDKQSILDEVSRLARDGYQEIVLTGIHITSYQTKEGNLVDLVEDMAKIPGITRIRLGSLEPSAVTEEFAKRLSKVDALCPHFHMSFQSGSDTVLQRMNRHYTTEEFKKSCELLKEYFSDYIQAKNFTLIEGDAVKKGDLKKEFGANPFSILDTKDGLWQARKKKWIN